MKTDLRPIIEQPIHSHVKHGIYEIVFKRVIDFALSFLAIIVLAPFALIVAVLVRIKHGSPVIFKQKRPGLNEQIFTLYKFKTMTDECNEEGELLPEIKRLTNFGIKLRTISLDEIPELVNILKGDMSIVGPRPLLVKYLPYYTDAERIRHSVRPGLTGLAQVNGRNYCDWDTRLAYDAEYTKKITFMSDARIILKTIWVVLFRKDIAEDPKAVEPEISEIRKINVNYIINQSE